MSEQSDGAAPGWEAIDGALHDIYGEREPLHFGTVVKWALGGPDPLDGVSVFAPEEPVPHWHYVSYGLSELYEKESDDPDVSGFGFELTLRLARTPGEGEPPMWPIALMQDLARYVFETGNVFADGHHLDLKNPIAPGEDTAVCGAIFLADPELGAELDTPHGRLSFLQIVGVTPDELEAIQAWDTGGFAELLAERTPLWVTDLARRSLLESGEGARIEEAIERQGSSTGELYASTVSWEQRGQEGREEVRVTIDALLARKLGRVLRGRLLHGRPLLLNGGASAANLVGFRPAEPGASGWSLDEGILVLELDEDLLRRVAGALAPERGEHAWEGLPRLTLAIVPCEIKDSEGNVLEVVG